MERGMRYAVLGRGRWGNAVHAALRGMGRRVAGSGLGRPAGDVAGGPDGRYADLLRAELDRLAREADILWMAIPPRDQVLVLREALRAGLHVIVEKPWMADGEATRRLSEQAREEGRVVGVNFQYCLQDEVRQLAARICEAGETPVRFLGRFTISRENRLGLPALENLGSHLMAIRNRYFGRAEVAGLVAGYLEQDERWFCVATDAAEHVCDLSGGGQDTVADLARLFETAVREGAGFPFDLCFARRVADDLEGLGRTARKDPAAAGQRNS